MSMRSSASRSRSRRSSHSRSTHRETRRASVLTLLKELGLRITAGLSAVSIGFHQYLQILLVVSIIAQALLLAGCSSPSAFGRSIYVTSFKYTSDISASTRDAPAVWRNVTALVNSTVSAAQQQLEVRAGYFRICATTTHGSSWTCASSAKHLDFLMFDAGADPLGIARLASRYRDEVLFPGLAIGSIALSAICFVVNLTFPTFWHTEHDPETGSEIEVRPFPSVSVVKLVIYLASLACVFALLSALWQHTSAATAATLAEAAGYGRIQASVGVLAAVLAWLAFAVGAAVAMGAAVVLLALKWLDDYYED